MRGNNGPSPPMDHSKNKDDFLGQFNRNQFSHISLIRKSTHSDSHIGELSCYSYCVCCCQMEHARILDGPAQKMSCHLFPFSFIFYLLSFLTRSLNGFLTQIFAQGVLAAIAIRDPFLYLWRLCIVMQLHLCIYSHGGAMALIMYMGMALVSEQLL